MALESNFWASIRRYLIPHARLKRMENGSASPGTPDVYYRLKRPPHAAGWLELKALPDWPKDASRPLTIRHFTALQVEWLEDEEAAGGIAMLFCKIDKDYIAASPSLARLIFEKQVTREIIQARARVFSPLKFPVAALLKAMGYTNIT